MRLIKRVGKSMSSFLLFLWLVLHCLFQFYLCLMALNSFLFSFQCDRCLPLYNNKPFQAGNQLNSYPCKLCQCYNHSSTCVYNASMDLFPSEYDNGGGGVCVACLHNTTGQMCDTCIAMFYRPNGKSLFAADVCLPCNCNPAGTLPGGMNCNKVPCHASQTGIRRQQGIYLVILLSNNLHLDPQFLKLAF